jgi:hypothetical protein
MLRTRREDRDRQRVERAAAAARAESGSALRACLLQISTAFDEAAAVNDFKIRVEKLLRLGPQHPALRARFGARAALLTERDLGDAILTVERWWREERKVFQIASALGYGNRFSFEVLRELRLILRLIRFKHMAADFGAMIEALCDHSLAMAAE